MAYRVARAGGVIAEVPIRFVDRERGASKMSPRVIAEALRLVTRLGLDARRRRPSAAKRPGDRGGMPNAA